jgi:uncharacterized protein
MPRVPRIRYPAHDAFVAPARARPALWRLTLGLLLAVGVVSLFPLPILGLVAWAAGSDAVGDLFYAVLGLDTPGAVLFLLGGFAGMALGTALAVRLLHGRSPATLFGPWPRLWRHFLVAAGLTLSVIALAALIPSDTPVRPNLAPHEWGLFLVSGLLALLLQTGAEEALFRGYLQQQLAARFRSPLIWLLLPALLFGALHVNPADPGPNMVLILAVTALFGLLAADLTAATGSLGAAWGFHFANNVYGVLILGVEGQITGLALFVAGIDTADPAAFRAMVAGSAATLLIVWAAIRLALTRSRRVGDRIGV